MSTVEERLQRLEMYGCQSTGMAQQVVSHFQWAIRNAKMSAVQIRAAEQNVPKVMAEITRFVAQIESWGETDLFSYSSFNVAKQTLYLKYSIMVDLIQKEMSHPDWSFTDIGVTGYNKVFYDLELNASDPYFDTIKRDYYNEVSS